MSSPRATDPQRAAAKVFVARGEIVFPVDRISARALDEAIEMQEGDVVYEVMERHNLHEGGVRVVYRAVNRSDWLRVASSPKRLWPLRPQQVERRSAVKVILGGALLLVAGVLFYLPQVPQPQTLMQASLLPSRATVLAPVAAVVAEIPPPPLAALPKDLPEWIGYNRRGDTWWVRLRLPEGESVLLRQGATTPQGWRLSAVEARGNRLFSVTLTRGDQSHELKLIP
jgi:hypothetical protein